MPARFGDPVSLSYDHGDDTAPVAGDAIVPMSRRTGRPTGRAYLITCARPVRSGRFAGRRVMLDAVVFRLGDLPPGVRQHRLWWYDRTRRRS